MRKQKMPAERKKKRGIGGENETLTMTGVGEQDPSNNTIKTISYVSIVSGRIFLWAGPKTLR
jgi:hypothetical protein